jgi:hypothetical protein
MLTMLTYRIIFSLITSTALVFSKHPDLMITVSKLYCFSKDAKDRKGHMIEKFWIYSVICKSRIIIAGRSKV